MIERVRIADIMTPADEVIFYDPAMEEEYLKFCTERDIDYLPSLKKPNSKVYCKRADNTFEERTIEIDDDLRVDADVDVFSEQALSKFEQNKVLFVYDCSEFCGVVHFSDYNKDVINIYLYKLLSQYEKSIRELLRKYGLENSDMKEFFELKKRYRINTYNRLLKGKILTSKPHFDQFYIDDLIGLLNHKIEDVNLDLEKVKELRNSIMHSNELLNKGQEDSALIFDVENFSTFFHRVQILKKDMRKVKTKLQLISLKK